MTEVKQTRLPGTGVRHDFQTKDGIPIGVLLHHSGRRELLVYRRDDPDACAAAVSLDGEEAGTLVELLGGSHVSEAVGAVLRQRIKGLAIDWIEVGAGSVGAGASLRSSALRTQTGGSVVAVIRDETTYPSPAPEFVLEPGDTVVAVGTDEGIRALSSLLNP